LTHAIATYSSGGCNDVARHALLLCAGLTYRNYLSGIAEDRSMRPSLLSLIIAAMLCSRLLSAEPVEMVPTHVDVSYGPHERNVLDFFAAPGNGPRPVLVYIHGGGWVGGDKKQKDGAIKPFLDQGISCAAVNYRLTGTDSLPAPVHDAARAIQFLRTRAQQWSINKSRIALTGGSAGACTSMWILLHDDLADLTATDPVQRESTRVTAAAAHAGQTSIDPPVIEGWLGPNVLKHRMIWMAVGEPDMASALANYNKHQALYREFSPINHLDRNDPPLFMAYGNNMTLPSEDAGHGIHHPVFGLKMKEKADQLGHECHLVIDGVSKSDKYKNSDTFLADKLLNASDSK
jgi:acetyl esterase/lipase